MARLLIQSQATGLFLVPDPQDGQPGWVSSLREAGGGVVADVDTAAQLVQDWCDAEDAPVLVDLDRLGTANDYPVEAAEGLGPHGRRAGLFEAAGGLSSLPVGNHGDNNFSGGHRA